MAIIEHDECGRTPGFAHSPPDRNLMADLWDRHLRKGYRKTEPVRTNPEKDAEILARFNGFRDQATIFKQKTA